MYACTFDYLLTQYGPNTPAGKLTLERTPWAFLGDSRTPLWRIDSCRA